MAEQGSIGLFTLWIPLASDVRLPGRHFERKPAYRPYPLIK